MPRYMSVTALAAAAALLTMAAGCGRMGQVQQGRVVEYDAAKGIVRMVVDGSEVPGLDATLTTVKIPADPGEMGPAPAPGSLVAIDRENHQLIVFDSEAGSFRKLSYSPVEEHDNIHPADPRVKGKSFPVIDPAAKTITVYDPATRVLLTFAASETQLGLPPSALRAGDEIRYYYKEPGQALRMMNVTRTDISTGH